MTGCMGAGWMGGGGIIPGKDCLRAKSRVRILVVRYSPLCLIIVNHSYSEVKMFEGRGMHLNTVSLVEMIQQYYDI